MSSKFECYVTINKKKWTIVINKKINCVNFGDVYRQICKTCDPKLNISHETHVFEMFDGDHFKPLTSFGAPIKCLARIRVNLPPDVDKDKDQSTERIDNIDNNSRAKRHKSDDNRDKSGQQFVSSFKPSNDATTSGSSVQTTHHSNNEYKKSKHSSSYKKESDRESRRKESHNAFKNEGIVVKEEKTCCELCGKTFTTMTDAVKHIQSFEHMKNKREDSFDEIDKQFLAEIRDKKDIRCLLSRKQELSKFGEKEKRIFIKHGIRLKDGIGSQSYVCIRCDQSFHDSLQMVQHFNHYINQKPMPTNESINECPTSDKRTAKNVTNSDDISDTKIVDFKVPEDVADKVKQLERQGFQVIPKSKHKFVMKCRFCDFYTKSISKSFKHIESEEHIKWKTEMPFKGIDRLIVTESSNSSEIDCLLARIEAIREIPYTVKEEFLSHGMKVKDGLGANAYVCTKCNVLFERLSDCKNHLKDFKKIKNSLLNKNSDSIADELDIEKSADFELFIKQLESNCESIDSILRNEGIKYKKCDKSVHKHLSVDCDEEIPDIYYHCLFCNTNFYSKETALYHVNRSFHKKIRRGEYMTPIEAMFTVKSDRIDELDIGFARMEALQRLDNKTKIDLRDKGIRLKDGIGADAYVCLKCNKSIACETIDSALFAIIRHNTSRDHLKFVSH